MGAIRIQQDRTTTWLDKPIKSILLLAVLMLPFVAVLLNNPATQALSVSSVRDCDANAVINCGALSTAELQNKCSASSSVQVIFNDFGIGSCDIGSLGTVMGGQVTKDGQVFAGGNLVATNALTAGRQNIAGSTAVTRNGVTFFTRPPSVSFVSSPLAAFVVMQNGQFKFAVLASCGNPVKATPVAKPAPVVKKTTPKPKVVTKVVTVPVPAPAQTQSQTQSQFQSQNITIQQTPTAPTTNTTSSTAQAQTTQQAAESQAETTQAQSTPVTQPVATTTLAPQQLPNTGSGDILGFGAFVTLFSGLAHFFYRRLKFN